MSYLNGSSNEVKLLKPLGLLVMVDLETEEGHDTCIALRVSPVAEAASAPVPADLIPVKLTRRGLPDQNHG